MPQKSNKIIISCAVTGSIHTPTMSDALPITPDQIATQAIDAAHAGAAILHLHARDPKDGRPSPDPKIFMQFLPRIKQSCDAIVNITTGGAVTMTVEQRISAANQLSPEMCSLNMGSMNFALYPMARRYKTWKYDWEEPYLTQSDAYIFPNTFRDIEKVYRTLGEGHGVKFEHECYDTGHLYNLAHCIDRGLFKPPVVMLTTASVACLMRGRNCMNTAGSPVGRPSWGLRACRCRIAAPALAASIDWVAIWSGVIGSASDMVGVWIEPVTAQVMTTLLAS